MAWNSPIGATVMRALSLNLWGVPNAPQRLKRVLDAADILEANENGYDVVCVQECYVAADVRRLIAAARLGKLVHCHVFRNGAGCWGSNSPGMVVLSRFPIVQARLCRFACSGKVHKLWQMDGIHHKAIGLVALNGGSLGLLCVYVTHFVAVYGPGDEYYGHRLLQAREAARFIDDTSRDASLVVMCGDLNAEPSHAVYKHLVAAAALRDTVTPCDTTLATYARPGNPYVTGPGCDKPARLDYVLWRSSHAVGTWSVTDSGIDDATDQRGVSDHAGVFAEFSLNPGAGSDNTVSSPHVRRPPHTTLRRHNLHLMSALKSAIAQCGATTHRHKMCAIWALVFAACIYAYAPWLTPLAVALAVVHFVIYGVGCGEEMSSLVQAHNEVAIQLGCKHPDAQVMADDMGDAFEYACVMLAMGG